MCVPTPITTTKDPDLAPVLSAAATIRDNIRRGQLVDPAVDDVPGHHDRPVPREARAERAQGRPDFDLAFAPERVNPGDPASASKGVPRLVGATTPEATARAAALLRRINDQVVELSSPDAAELAKLLENVFRNVNIAFVNQLALLCERMGLDVWEVINAAATKPFGFMKFTPGPGVGGHCIPVDPYYLAWRAREFDFIDRFIELAGDINFAMPRHVVDLVGEALNDRGRALKGAQVGVLGVAFKPNVRDARNSPAADVLAGLAARGGDVRFHDPHVEAFTDSTGTGPRGDAAPRSPRMGRRDRRRHRALRHRLGAGLRRRRSRRRHRRLLARPRRPTPPGAAPRGRMVERQLSAGSAGRSRTTASARTHRGTTASAPPRRRPVLMIVHSHYDEDPRVRREAESLVAAGRPVVVLGLRLPGLAPRTRCRASGSTGSTSSATREPASASTCASTSSSSPARCGWRPASIDGIGSGSSRSTRCRTSSRSPRCRSGSWACRSSSISTRRCRSSSSSASQGPSNPVFDRLLLLQERLSIAISSRTLSVNSAMRGRLLRLGVRPDKVASSSTAHRSRGSTRRPIRPGLSARTARCGSIYTGGLTPTYEVDVAVRAVARLAAGRPDLDPRLEVYGRGDTEEPVTALADELGVGDR